MNILYRGGKHAVVDVSGSIFGVRTAIIDIKIKNPTRLKYKNSFCNRYICIYCLNKIFKARNEPLFL